MQDSFDLQDAALPRQFGLGCLTIRNGHLWRLSHVVWSGTARSVGATFFCDLKPPWDATNLLRIETYKLPSGAHESAERIQWYTRNRKSRPIKIADGQRFDPGMLNIKCFTDEWDADAFALSKGEVIRTYRTKTFAVIFRLVARSGTLLDHPIFKRLIKDVSFDPDTWEKQAPGLTEKRRTKTPVESTLSPEEERELKQLIRGIEKRLSITKSTKADRRLELVQNEIKQLRSQAKGTKASRAELAMELGAEIGQCFCIALDWQWRRLTYPNDATMVGVCCPERRLVLCPSAWVADLLSSQKRPINCLLTFNMIQGGRLPPTRLGAYTRIN